MRSLYVLLTAVVALQPLVAQRAPSSRFGTPALGFVYDGDLHAIRPILGVPGAAVVGEPLALSFSLVNATPSPAQTFLLARSGGDDQVWMVRVDQNPPAALALPDVQPAPDRMFFSPNGRTAVLYGRSGGRLQVVTGLPDAPAIRGDYSLAGVLDAAVSDDGTRLIAMAADEQGEAAWLFSPDAAAVRLSLPASITHVAFAAGGHDAVAASSDGELFRIQDGNEVSRYPYAADAPSRAVALQLSADGARAFVVNVDRVIVVDLPTGQSSALSCSCKLTGLYPLQSPAVFRLNDLSPNSPVFLFDTSSPAPRMWFVPAAPAPAEAVEPQVETRQ